MSERSHESSRLVRRRVVVEGRVQGVFFRDSCRRAAAAAGVSGWVRNLADGSVEAVFEGGRESIEEMVKWCHEGPPRALVTRIHLEDEVPRGEASFRIR